MDGQQIWKELWKLKPLEIHQCLIIWFPRRLCRSIQITQLFHNLERNPRKTEVTRLLKILSGFCSIPPFLHQDSLLMSLHLSLVESIEWSSSVSQLMMTKLRKNSPILRNHLEMKQQLKQLQAKWKKLIDKIDKLCLYLFLFCPWMNWSILNRIFNWIKLDKSTSNYVPSSLFGLIANTRPTMLFISHKIFCTFDICNNVRTMSIKCFRASFNSLLYVTNTLNSCCFATLLIH